MLMAVDPGQNTGMAFRFDNGNWGTLTVQKVPDAAERFDMVLSLLLEQLDGKHGRVNTLVMESFKTMSRYLSKYGLETIELVGAVRALCYVKDVPVVHQMPAQRLAFEKLAADMLKKRDVMFTDHEVSALAHLLCYEYRTEQVAKREAASA